MLTLLKEVLPAVTRIDVLEWSGDPYFRVTREQFEHTCRSLRLDPDFAGVATAGEIEVVIAQLARQHVQVLMARGSGFFLNTDSKSSAADEAWPADTIQ